MIFWFQQYPTWDHCRCNPTWDHCRCKPSDKKINRPKFFLTAKKLGSEVESLQGSDALLKLLDFKTGFQYLEKVLNLAKMCIRYWKSVEVLYGKEISSIWAEFCWRQSNSIFMQCVKSSFMIKNFEKWREVMILNLWNLVLKRFKKGTGKIIFLNVFEPWVPDLDNYNFFSFSKLELTWDQTQLSQIRIKISVISKTRN